MNKILKCETCGSKLEYNEDKQLYCPQCGNLYSNTPDVNKTYVTNNNNVVKNFYGNTGKTEIEKDKIEGYFIRAFDDYKIADYSQAKDYVVRIIVKEPDNNAAIIFKEMIDCHKGSNGRYEKRNFIDEKLISILTNCIEKQKNKDSRLVELFDIAINEFYSTPLDFNRIYSFWTTKPEDDFVIKLEELLTLIDDKNNDELNDIRSIIEKHIIRINNRISDIQKGIELKEQNERELAENDRIEKRNHAIKITIGVLIMAITLALFPIIVLTTSINKSVVGAIIFFVTLFEAMFIFRKK